ncbi:hypothetical protein [Paenibacillus woosongensis]|uniref:Uncharacterized protein n=1 Tax=Paenibacillus woosongensis TaxID=307580 RepID=A0ABQ4MPI6_9BACL|nr:hypothetical protein [Paenibacillus woosongensis]GIP57919.1 hypothetical protein J15TS10_17330 [Paenibacillus woosongensis]
MKLDKVTGGHFHGAFTGVKAKSQYELDKEKGFPLRDYIREIVREEIAAHEERQKVEQTVVIQSSKLGDERPYYGVPV